MKRDEIIYEPDFYIDQIDHTVPILHYHLGRYMTAMNDDWDDDDLDALDVRIDGRKCPFYPGDTAILEIKSGERDPLEYGLLPYMRGWEWCLWLVPMPWLDYLPQDLEMTWIDGGTVRSREIDTSLMRQVFGMIPAGFLLGTETERFPEGCWLHDQLIEKFTEAKSAKQCTNMVFEKSLAGDWYFPDVICILEDLNMHVDTHRAMLKDE